MNYIESVYKDYTGLLNYSQSLLRDPDQAYDIMHEAILKAMIYAQSNKIDDVGHMRSVVFKIIKTEASKIYRKNFVIKRHNPYLKQNEVDEDLLEIITNKQALYKVSPILNSLPEIQRDIIYLNAIGLSLKKIESILNYDDTSLSIIRRQILKFVHNKLEGKSEQVHVRTKAPKKYRFDPETRNIIISMLDQGMTPKQIAEKMNAPYKRIRSLRSNTRMLRENRVVA